MDRYPASSSSSSREELVLVDPLIRTVTVTSAKRTYEPTACRPRRQLINLVLHKFFSLTATAADNFELFFFLILNLFFFSLLY